MLASDASTQASASRKRSAESSHFVIKIPPEKLKATAKGRDGGPSDTLPITSTAPLGPAAGRTPAPDPAPPHSPVAKPSTLPHSNSTKQTAILLSWKFANCNKMLVLLSCPPVGGAPSARAAPRPGCGPAASLPGRWSGLGGPSWFDRLAP